MVVMDDEPQSTVPDDEMPEGRASRGAVRRFVSRAARTVRAAIAAHPRTSAAVACGLLVVGLVLALWLRPAPRSDASLARALAALDRGALTEARTIAVELRGSPDYPPAYLGGPLFVLGAVASEEAARAYGDDRRRLLRLSVRLLSEARDRGFPSSRAAQGYALLGRAQLSLGQFVASRENLLEALRRDAALGSSLHRLIAVTYLRDDPPDFAAGRRHIEAYLADASLDASQRDAGRIDEAELEFRSGNPEAARRVLDTIAPDSPLRSEVLVLRAAMLMDEADRRLAAQQASAARSAPDAAADATDADPARDPALAAEAAETDAAPARDAAEAAGHAPARSPQRPTVADLEARAMFQQAIALLREAQAADTLPNQSTRKAMYLVGICYLRLGQDEAALEQFDRTARTHLDSEEGVAASLELADLLRTLGHAAEALLAYQLALEAVGPLDEYSNVWVAREQFQLRLRAAYRGFVDTRHEEQAVGMARLLAPLVSRSEAILLEAEAQQTWGRRLLTEVGLERTPAADALAHEARTHLRRAGRLYAILCRLRLSSREYPEYVWSAATSYLAGHDFENAVRHFRRYLENEARERRPQALLGLGEALLSLDRLSEALAALDECLEAHPRDPAVYRARLVAAQVHQEAGRSDRAAALLLRNLDDGVLAPDSVEWRESKFAYARLLHLQMQYAEALPQLDEAIRRYPDDPQTPEARYLLADSARRRGRELLIEARHADQAAVRQSHAARGRALLEQAATVFSELVTRFGERQASRPLSDEEQALFRNAYFGQGAALFEMERYADAAEVYTSLANRLQSSPVALEAYVELATCYRRLGQSNEARSILEQARIVLRRLPEDADFARVTIHPNRTEWERYLDDLLALFSAVPAELSAAI